jgi:thiazole/oxazole-forming peptide maturase SagC family component
LEKRPRRKSQFSVIAHSPDSIELRYGVWNPASFSIRDETNSGKLYQTIVALDGSRSTGDIAREVGLARSEVEGIVDYLDQLGLIEFGPTNVLDLYTHHLVPSLQPHSRSDRAAICKKSIVILSDDALAKEIERTLTPSVGAQHVSTSGGNCELLQALKQAPASVLSDGLQLSQLIGRFSPWDESFLIAAQSTIDPLRLDILNRICLARKIPWIHAAIDGPFLFVGPTILPYRTACYKCFETRITMNLRESASYQNYKVALINSRITEGTAPAHPVIHSLLAAHCSFDALNFWMTASNFTTGKVLAIYLPTMELAFQEVLRLPGCPACGSQAGRDDTELYFDLRSVIGRQ